MTHDLTNKIIIHKIFDVGHYPRHQEKEQYFGLYVLCFPQNLLATKHILRLQDELWGHQPWLLRLSLSAIFGLYVLCFPQNFFATKQILTVQDKLRGHQPRLLRLSLSTSTCDLPWNPPLETSGHCEKSERARHLCSCQVGARAASTRKNSRNRVQNVVTEPMSVSWLQQNHSCSEYDTLQLWQLLFYFLSMTWHR